MNRDKIIEITKKNACEIPTTNTNTIHSSNIPPSSIKRINVSVDEDIDLLFRKLASQKFKFNRGWYSQAMTGAMELWIKYNISVDEDTDLLFRKLASQKFKFNMDWYSQAMTEAMELWIKYNISEK